MFSESFVKNSSIVFKHLSKSLKRAHLSRRFCNFLTIISRIVFKTLFFSIRFVYYENYQNFFPVLQTAQLLTILSFINLLRFLLKPFLNSINSSLINEVAKLKETADVKIVKLMFIDHILQNV